ncbi:hypothetical protein G8O24_08770 [Bradyrhizobium sp. INPA01-394B]|uniref:Uncharacterized protein n=1 Tax=Bradyrhizobium campsiandrae TaxID=1729892 RepID=A0ABR7TZS6_9BRAD|nr:hypothetical protein [Bradyrhizobium campsiandrae]MBC9877438.1 hypothetical protein [Bradyrhizobium campsiandrae]MBC9976843.1 hypothetical protein [Bradyrhizobium campsiandrae]
MFKSATSPSAGMFAKSHILLSVLATLFLTSSCLGQAAPAQSPIVCDFKDGLAVEDATCQAKLKGLFERKGDTLILNLDGGTSKAYIGNSAACDGENVDASKCLVFRMLRYFPQSQFYLVEKGLYECGDYLFVSRRTGRETVMSAMPVLSPNGRYLLSIDDSDACERKYDIAVWSMRTDPPELEFNYQAKQYENWELTTWKDDTHIRLKAWINGKTSYDQEAELVRGAEGWTLKLGKKTDRPR